MSDKNEVPEGYLCEDTEDGWVPCLRPPPGHHADNETLDDAIAACHAHKRARWAEGIRMAAQALRAAQRSTGGMGARVAAPEWLEGFADRLESGEASGG